MIGSEIGRYHILEEIGRGGLGIIYKAEDPVLLRNVAIKILPPTLVSETESRDRFIREAQAAAKLNHPNILGIYDINEHEGMYFVVFEYAPGTTLEAKMEKQPVFELNAAAEIFVPVLEAIDYAHQNNVLHRDIKPANILITDENHVKVADFGLAWLESEQSLNETGTALGTFAYFSPEQTRGERLDRRTDIYSLGVVLYQMLTGKLPFTADNPAALIEAHLTQEPVPPSKSNRAISPAVEACILKALKRNPDDRYETVTEMIEAFTKGVYGEARMPSISPTEAAEYNTRGSTFYKQGNLDLAMAEWEKATEKDPYNALIHNNLGTAYDGLGKVDLAVSEYEKAVQLNPNNFVAHYNLGSAYYRVGNLDSGIAQYKTVVALNPKFAPAHYNLGNCYYKKGDFDQAVAEWQNTLANKPDHAEAIYNLGNASWRKGKFEEAHEQWKHTLEIDPNFALASFNIGAYYYKEGKFDEAKAEWDKALSTNPEFAEAQYNMGILAYERNQLGDAIEAWEKVVKIRPTYWQAYYNLGNAYYQKDDLALSEENWKRTVELRQEYWQAHWNLANLHAFRLSRIQEALLGWQAVTALKNDHWPAYFNIGETYFNEGKMELARLEWIKVIELNPKYWPAYHNLAAIAYALGDYANAISWWAKSLAYLVFAWP